LPRNAHSHTKTAEICLAELSLRRISFPTPHVPPVALPAWLIGQSVLPLFLNPSDLLAFSFHRCPTPCILNLIAYGATNSGITATPSNTQSAYQIKIQRCYYASRMQFFGRSSIREDGARHTHSPSGYLCLGLSSRSLIHCYLHHHHLRLYLDNTGLLQRLISVDYSFLRFDIRWIAVV